MNGVIAATNSSKSTDPSSSLSNLSNRRPRSFSIGYKLSFFKKFLKSSMVKLPLVSSSIA